jgi:(p)ppGpp synthase/HD superfamily hydrolase
MTDEVNREAEVLGRALAIATEVHEGQVDKLGAPYLGHPLRVAARVVDAGYEAVAAALLHDVLEDSDLTAADLRARGIPGAVVRAVVALTHVPDEPYEAAVRRAAADPLARTVKRADLADNLDPSRAEQLPPDVRARLQRKYARASAILDEGRWSPDTVRTPS